MTEAVLQCNMIKIDCTVDDVEGNGHLHSNNRTGVWLHKNNNRGVWDGSDM